MDVEHKAKLNEFLVTVFNDILKMEEQALIGGNFSDLSLSEIHVIEAVAKQENQSAANVAALLLITKGTLSVAVNTLIKKGYLLKTRDPHDKRITRLSLTEKGKAANEFHKKYHNAMVQSVTNILNDNELDILLKSLNQISTHFKNFKFE